MNKRFHVVLLMLASLALFGFTPPDHSNKMIVDQAGVLSQAEEEKLNKKLMDYARSSNNEIAVLIATDLQGAAIEDAAHSTFQTWPIGKKGLDNGVLLLIAVKDRKMRIEVGEGVEGELTDLQSKNIIRAITPLLKEKKFAAGINTGIDGISNTLEGRAVPGNPDKEDEGFPWMLILLLGGCFLFLIIKGRVGGGYSGGGYGGGGGSWSGGGSSGGSFGGGFGGGSSGGGGASGDW